MKEANKLSTGGSKIKPNRSLPLGSTKEPITVCACCKGGVADELTVPVKVSSSDVDIRTLYVCPVCRTRYSDSDFESMLGSV